MKRLFLILLLFPFVSSAQDIPKKTRFIDIHNTLTSSQNFGMALHMLGHHKLEIDQNDKELGLITTVPKEFKEHSIFYTLSVKDSLITIRGQYRKTDEGSTFKDVRANTKLFNSPEGERAMKQMLVIAKSLGKDFTFRK